MKHFRTMLVGLGIGLGGVVVGSLPGQPALQADGTRHTVPVAVENTPTVNVGRLPAITGSVSIAGQPVSVNVNSLPSVQLVPGTTVGVTGGNFTFSNTPGTPIFVRDKDNPALTPFQTELCSACLSPGNSFAVPTGKRAVIEFISSICGTTVGGLQLFTTVGGFQATYPLNPGQQDIFGNMIANQQTRIYADPGTFIALGGGFTAARTTGPCDMFLSGYLVTL